MTERHLSVFAESLEVALADQGEGQVFLLLHGGAGRHSMMGLAEHLAKGARVIVPVHPGFNGEARPAWFTSVEHLALAYLQMLETLKVRNVTVIGNSLGGWVAAEMALHHSPRIAGIILLNAVGVSPVSPDKPIVNPALLPVEQRAQYSFHDPARFASGLLDAATLKHMPGNLQAMSAYTGSQFMHDPTLLERLAGVRCKALVVWGKSDRIVDVDYGRRFAAAIPGAGLRVVPEAGHFPQIENLNEVAGLIEAFSSV